MKVNEIFKSVSGEVGYIPQGSIAWFVRFQGCNLECAWCDSPEARRTDKEAVNGWPASAIPDSTNVILTGGEPLLQEDIGHLVDELVQKKRCTVQIETNGSCIPSHPLAHYVMDYKTPSSGMHDRMLQPVWFSRGNAVEFVKFVCTCTEDVQFSFRKAVAIYAANRANGVMRPPMFAISLNSGDLMDYALDELHGRYTHEFQAFIMFNFQLHKYIGAR